MGRRFNMARYSGVPGEGRAARHHEPQKMRTAAIPGVVIRNGNPGGLTDADNSRRVMKPIIRRAARRAGNAAVRRVLANGAA